MKRLLGLCLYRMGSWMVEKSHPQLGHKWKKSVLEQLDEYVPIDVEKIDQWAQDLGEIVGVIEDIIVGSWECTS